MITTLIFKGQVRGWYNYRLFKRLQCCECCVVLFSTFSSLLICEKRDMTSLSMTSFHVDLNGGCQKCVDMPLTLLASLSHIHTLVQNTKWRRHLTGLATSLSRVKKQEKKKSERDLYYLACSLIFMSYRALLPFSK